VGPFDVEAGPNLPDEAAREAGGGGGVRLPFRIETEVEPDRQSLPMVVWLTPNVRLPWRAPGLRLSSP
jgi:hypothetical protein